jgi:hypothetical protein
MKNIFVAIITVTLTLAPASSAFAETLSNVGNGVDSTNNVTANQTNTTSVNQTNSASIYNDISVVSDTGNNTANSNTGGDVKVTTGDSGAKVKVENFANSNQAWVNGCCDAAGDATITNQGNGDSSDNDATLNTFNATSLVQDNYAGIYNGVYVDSNTGYNEADRNTGNGASSVGVTTGDALTQVAVGNAANSNKAIVGSPAAVAGAGSDLTIGNGGNGVDTDNSATANLFNSNEVYQSNAAWVTNWVGVESNTGYNTANSNTGGDVAIDTGDSAIAVGLTTQVNSNLAAIANNCGCVGLGDVVVKNLGNGDSADSDATLNKFNTSAAYQANASDVYNTGYFDSSTGNNEGNRNTGSVFGWSDPSIDTGAAYTNVGSATAANSNVLNSGLVSLGSGPWVDSNMSGSGSWWSWGWNAGGSVSN